MPMQVQITRTTTAVDEDTVADRIGEDEVVAVDPFNNKEMPIGKDEAEEMLRISRVSIVTNLDITLLTVQTRC